MAVNYCISILLLIISFLLLYKRKEKVSLVSNVIYSICLILCYQIVLFFCFSFLKNLLYYSFINYFISLIMIFITIIKKRKQKYYFDKGEFILFLLVFLSLFLVIWIRTRGFNSIIYFSDDSSIHFRASLTFSKKLSILSTKNTDDLIYSFDRMMPGFYINAGLFIKIFSFIKPYRAYMIFDAVSYILICLSFLVIIRNCFKKKSNILYYVITMLYGLSFPLNNFVFGFGYLGIGILTVQLLCYYLNDIKYKNNIIFNLIIIFILNFSLFFSYYLFVPPVYLSLFLYLIYLYKRKKINIKLLGIYIFVSLVIPFLCGFIYFILPSLFTSHNVFTYISEWGAIYNNVTPMYAFVFLVIWILFRRSTISDKVSFFTLIFYSFSIYIFAFLCLFVLKISQIYYYYKLFYVYAFIVFIYIIYYLLLKDKILYIMFGIVIISMIIIYILPDSKISSILSYVDVYNFNSHYSTDKYIRYNKDELELIDMAIENSDICSYDNHFIVAGSYIKKSWFYSAVGYLPNLNYYGKNTNQLYDNNITIEAFEYLDDYKCVVYFNDGINNADVIKNYNILFENKYGAILMKKDS